jgi:hypothetical protein
VLKLEKDKLLIIPFFIGLILMIYSWYLSFPLAVNSFGDSVFNHISILYWISVPLLLTSMFLIAITFKNRYLPWIMTVGFVAVLYSQSYFYLTMTTGDSTYFRGLTENFLRTNNLNASQFIHNYYQWPSFFLLASITTLVSGLKLTTYEFLLFTVIGFLIGSSLYIYASKKYSHIGFLAVVAFFVAMFYYLNYQAVPFSLAFALLLVLFMLETYEQSGVGVNIIVLILYASTVITHAFVPLFFVIYLLIRSIITRSRHYFELFMLTLIIFVVVQITFAVFSFKGNFIMAFSAPSEYSSVVGAATALSSVAADAFPRLFSRTVTVAFVIISIVGFVLLIFRRKLRKIEKALLLTGAVYLGLGVPLYVLGYRALPIFFIPISLGVPFLFQSKFRKYLKYFVVILLVFVVFIPIHSSFNNPTTLQTKEDLSTANFMIEKYDWNSKSIVITDNAAKWYISPQVPGNTAIDADLSPTIRLSNITDYDCIVSSVGLVNTLQVNDISIEKTSQQIISKFDLVYSSGFSYVALKIS